MQCCNSMIYSNCFHGWLKAHTDKGTWYVNVMEGGSEGGGWMDGEVWSRVAWRRDRCGDGWIKESAGFTTRGGIDAILDVAVNRLAVCGHCDPRFMSCMATQPTEVHPSRAGRGRHPPPSWLRRGDSRTAAPPPPGPAGREGCSPADPRLQLQSVSNHE